MYQQIRDSIVGLLSGYAAQYPTVPLYYQNQQVDWNNLPDRFNVVEIEFYGADQIGMAASPKTRVAGYVYVASHTRVGLGSRESLGHLAWFASTLAYAQPGTVRLQAAEPSGSDEVPGWFIQEMKVPFYADSP